MTGMESKWLSHAGGNQLSNWIKPTQEEGHHAGYWKPSQLPGASEVMDLRKDSPMTTVLEQHNSKLYPYSHRQM